MSNPGPTPHGFPLYGLTAVVLTVLAAIGDIRQASDLRHAPSDYVQDYRAARTLLAGGRVYDPAPEDPAIAPTFGPGSVGADAKLHPPAYVLMLLPLGLFSYPVAFMLLSGVSAAAGAAAGWLVGREVGLSPWLAFWVAAAVLLHPGAVTCLSVGNVSLILLLATTIAWIALRRRADASAGVWVGLATAVKLYPGLLGAGFLLAGRPRAAVAFALTLTVAGFGSAAVVGFDQTIEYATVRAPASAAEDRGHPFNLSLVGVAERLFGKPSKHLPTVERIEVRPLVASVLALAGQGGVILTAGLAITFGSRHADRVFAVGLPAMLLANPLTWLHAVPMILVPTAILAREGWQNRRYTLLVGLGGCVALTCVDDLAVAVRLVHAVGEPLPAWVNVPMLAPTAGMLGVYGLAVRSGRTNSDG